MGRVIYNEQNAQREKADFFDGKSETKKENRIYNIKLLGIGAVTLIIIACLLLLEANAHDVVDGFFYGLVFTLSVTIYAFVAADLWRPTNYEGCRSANAEYCDIVRGNDVIKCSIKFANNCSVLKIVLSDSNHVVHYKTMCLPFEQIERTDIEEVTVNLLKGEVLIPFIGE